jgi:hypothetical protein
MGEAHSLNPQAEALGSAKQLMLNPYPLTFSKILALIAGPTFGLSVKAIQCPVQRDQIPF